jgi:catechol 2,3-dioxygenase-like lactoylglutathione lyase family enzyme
MDSRGVEGIEHVALHVESLTQAEKLYGRLFGMEVVERRACFPPLDEEEGEGESGRPECSVLEGSGFRLALRREVADFAAQGRLSHICLRLPPEHVAALLDRAEGLGCLVMARTDGRHSIEDPYEVRWEIASLIE